MQADLEACLLQVEEPRQATRIIARDAVIGWFTRAAHRPHPHGASAKLIAQYAGNRVLHLFDTCEGLPETSPKDGERIHADQFPSTLEGVQRYMGHDHVRYYKGLFPDTAGPVERTVFSLCTPISTSIKSTLSCLEFFYPRLAPGGILLSHDYLTAGGVDAAFQKFFADRPEPVIELSGYQCMMVKTRGSAPSGVRDIEVEIKPPDGPPNNPQSGR